MFCSLPRIGAKSRNPSECMQRRNRCLGGSAQDHVGAAGPVSTATASRPANPGRRQRLRLLAMLTHRRLCKLKGFLGGLSCQAFFGERRRGPLQTLYFARSPAWVVTVLPSPTQVPQQATPAPGCRHRQGRDQIRGARCVHDCCRVKSGGWGELGQMETWSFTFAPRAQKVFRFSTPAASNSCMLSATGVG